MDLSRAVYDRDLKIAAMRALDEIAARQRSADEKRKEHAARQQTVAAPRTVVQ